MTTAILNYQSINLCVESPSTDVCSQFWQFFELMAGDFLGSTSSLAIISEQGTSSVSESLAQPMVSRLKVVKDKIGTVQLYHHHKVYDYV